MGALKEVEKASGGEVGVLVLLSLPEQSGPWHGREASDMAGLVST